MLRAIVFAAILLGWPQMAKCQNGKPTAPAQQAAADTKPVEPVHVVIEQPVPAITARIEAADHEQESKEESWKRFFTPEWVIVYVTAIYAFIAGCTLLAIKGQARTMERQRTDSNTSSGQTLAALERQITALESHVSTAESQAKLMEEQTKLQARLIDLQERQMQQWIDLRNWHAELRTAGDWGTPREPEGARYLNIGFEFFNDSGFPLTLEARISFEAISAPKRKGEVSVKTVLLPKIPVSSGGHMELDERQQGLFENDLMIISVTICLIQTGHSGRKEPERSSEGFLICGKSKTTFGYLATALAPGHKTEAN